MAPNIKTIERCTIGFLDVAAALGGSEAGARKWLSAPMLPHLYVVRRPLFRVDEVVVRLRRARKRGCDGKAARALLQIDQERRAAAGVYSEPAMPLGADADRRSAELRAALTDDELSRYLVVRGMLHAALVRALWADAWRANIGELLDLALIHPTVMQFVLTADQKELPRTTESWTNWANSFATSNMILLKKVA